MKREYVRPTAVVENFTANEYVAACTSTQEWVYKFTCNAPETYDIYQETNGVPGIQTSGGRGYRADKNLLPGLLYYHPCGETHEVKVPAGTPATSVFSMAYYSDGTPAYFWDGGNNNVHLMMTLDPDVIDVPVVKS